jgi:hypothetical protein
MDLLYQMLHAPLQKMHVLLQMIHVPALPFDPPSKWWTPLLSSIWSRKVFYGYGTSSISG